MVLSFIADELYGSTPCYPVDGRYDTAVVLKTLFRFTVFVVSFRCSQNRAKFCVLRYPTVFTVFPRSCENHVDVQRGPRTGYKHRLA